MFQGVLFTFKPYDNNKFVCICFTGRCIINDIDFTYINIDSATKFINNI